MDLAAALDDLGLETFEVIIEIGENMVLNGARLIAQRVEFGQPLGRLAPSLGEPGAQLGERLLQIFVGQGALRVGDEIGRRDLHGASRRLRR